MGMDCGEARVGGGPGEKMPMMRLGGEAVALGCQRRKWVCLRRRREGMAMVRLDF